MNILLGTHYLAKTGGTENYTYALAMELKRLGHDVEYFAFDCGRTASRLEEQGIPFMTRQHYDLILANHTTVVEKLWTFGFLIQTCHGTLPELEQPSPYADAYVAVSPEVRQHLQSLGYEATVIPNGIDCRRFFPKRPVSQKLSSVLSLCHSDIANDFIERCCQRAGLKLIQCNKFKENVWEIEEVINECDLVIGLGRSAYDALACGRCVLVYDYRDYMREFLGEGMITPDTITQSMSCNCSGRARRMKYDEASFVEEMQKYSPELAAWSREYALKHLNIEGAVQSYLTIGRDNTALKARLGKMMEANREQTAALMAECRQLESQASSLQQQLAEAQDLYISKGRKHLRAIRALLWLSIALLLSLAALTAKLLF